MTCLPRCPRHPSERIVYLALSSTPGSKLSFFDPSKEIPISPVVTPTIFSFSTINEDAGNPGKISISIPSAYSAIHLQRLPRLII